MFNRLALVAALLAAPLVGMPAALAQEEPWEEDDALEAEADLEEEVSAKRFNPGDLGSLGYSFGFDPRTWQFASGAFLRSHPWGPFSEAMLGFTTRSQAIDPTQTYAIESFGINAGLGAQAWFLRAGVMTELAWLKRVVQNQGKLSFQHAPGFLVEPYVGTVLPFFQTPFTTLDARVYVPLGTLAPNLAWLGDPALGPRVMVSLWIGLPNVPDEAEPEEDIEDLLEEDHDVDEGEEEDGAPAQ